MFDRFTDKAKISMNLSRKAAQEFGHSYLAPEHILHGLLHAGECRASQMLAATATAIRDLLTDLRGRMAPPEPSVNSQLPFTAGAKKTLERAMETAAEVGHNWIGTEHLLVGLAGIDSSIVAGLFRKYGLDSEKLLQALVDTDRGPEDGPQDPDERIQGRRTAKQQEQILERALRVALELGDEPAARAIWGLIQKLKT